MIIPTAEVPAVGVSAARAVNLFSPFGRLFCVVQGDIRNWDAE